MMPKWAASTLRYVQELDRVRERQPGLGAALEREHAMANGGTPEAVARRSHVGQGAPASRSRIEQLDLCDRRAVRLDLLAAEHDNAAVAQPHRRYTAARRPQVGQPLPAPAPRVVALRGREIRGIASRQHVEAPAGRDAGGVVARRSAEARSAPPAPPADVIDLERAQRARTVRPASHVEPLADERRRLRRAWRWRGSQLPPPVCGRVVAKQRAGGLAERPLVSALDVQPSTV